jgi:hypothetical protein
MTRRLGTEHLYIDVTQGRRSGSEYGISAGGQQGELDRLVSAYETRASFEDVIFEGYCAES